LNVKIVATHGGITVGEDGFSHHAIEDLALACSLPGFRVIVPTDAIEASQVVRMAAITPGPFYIRLSRPATSIIYNDDYRFALDKAVTLRRGRDVTIIACGIMVAAALEAARRLEPRGLDCGVLAMPTLKPLDEEAIVQAATETGGIVTAEEHLEHGGLGSRVAKVVAEHRPVPMSFVAIKNTFAKSGRAEELLEKYGLTSADIERAALSVALRKRSHGRA
jgi:transketolase